MGDVLDLVGECVAIGDHLMEVAHVAIDADGEVVMRFVRPTTAPLD